jgi:anti-sigma regulatory factor (Ser/Thr protein kinase)
MKRTIQIRSEESVAHAVTMAAKVATSAGFDSTRVSAISTAVSEIARNIVKYADFGQVTIESVSDPEPAIDITARDRGQGIVDIDSALEDHYSTSGTLGLGLPGVRRLMDDFSIESTPGVGTTVRTRMKLGGSTPRRPKVPDGATPVRKRAAKRPKAGRGRTERLESGSNGDSDEIRAGSFVRPHRAEVVSGDLVVLRWIDQRMLAVVVDALGHGRHAARIAAAASEAVETITQADVLGTIDTIHEALRGSDGAAVAVAVASSVDRAVDVASVGNVRIRVLGPAGQRIPWTEGTLGQQFRRPVVHHRVLAEDTLVMYSDGVSDRFDDDEYRGAMTDPPDLAAKTIVERFGKDYDDASCAVLRFPR